MIGGVFRAIRLTSDVDPFFSQRFRSLADADDRTPPRPEPDETGAWRGLVLHVP